MNILGLLLGIFTIACVWCIFTKMNEPGWKSLIPFYNTYILIQKTTGSVRMAIFWSILPIILLLLEILPATPIAYTIGLNRLPLEPLIFITSVVLFFGYIYLEDKLSTSFGCGHWFTVGLVLLPPVFLALLAFGNYQFFDDSFHNLKLPDTNAPAWSNLSAQESTLTTSRPNPIQSTAQPNQSTTEWQPSVQSTPRVDQPNDQISNSNSNNNPTASPFHN